MKDEKFQNHFVNGQTTAMHNHLASHTQYTEMK